MQRNLNTRQWIDELERTAAELDTAKWMTERSPHLFRRARRTIVPAVRCVLESMKAGALPVYTSLKLCPELDYENARNFNSTDPNVLIWCWMHFLFPYLRWKAPRDFKPGAGAYDFAPLKTDPHGQLVGDDGEVLETVRTENGGLRLSGEPARITADYDETEMLEHFRHQFGDWADACRAAAQLLQLPGECPGTDTENINDQHVDGCADADANAAKSSSEQYVYKRSKEVYQVEFGSEAGHVQIKGNAEHYVERLLQKPNCPISALELTGAVQQSDDGSADEWQHKESLRKLRQQLREVDNDKAKTEYGQTPPADLEIQRQEILQEISRITNRKGQTTTVDKAADNARIAVRKGLNRFYKRLEKDFPKLKAHLSQSIKTEGCSYTYQPKELPDWKF